MKISDKIKEYTNEFNEKYGKIRECIEYPHIIQECFCHLTIEEKFPTPDILYNSYIKGINEKFDNVYILSFRSFPYGTGSELGVEIKFHGEEKQPRIQ